MVKHEYPHFNPTTHNLDVKIATVRTGSHCKFNINYHLIWIPKYRKPVLTGKVTEMLRTMIKGICYEEKMEMLACEIMPDHLHLFVGARPTHNPATIVHRLKGNTSYQLRKAVPDIRYLGYKNHYGTGFKSLWARGYYCGSAGHVSQEQVKRYIEEQDGKDVFEYNIYNDPTGQSKIGDFTSEKR